MKKGILFFPWCYNAFREIIKRKVHNKMKSKVYKKTIIVLLIMALTVVFSVPAMAETSKGADDQSGNNQETVSQISGVDGVDPVDGSNDEINQEGSDDDPSQDSKDVKDDIASDLTDSGEIEKDVKKSIDEDISGESEQTEESGGKVDETVNTEIKGAFKNIKVLKYSTVKPKKSVVINHGVGRTVYLEKKNKGEWKVVRKYKASKKDSSKTIKINFATEDYKQKAINWRIRVPETVIEKKEVVDGKVVVKDIKYKKAIKKAKTVVSKFSWPVPGHKWITSGFGGRICPFHGREFHAGVDIAASKGTKVHAAADGVVIKATYHYSLGNHIVISHSNGKKVTTWYNHLSKIKVKKGQKVKRGQIIGKVGSTGTSTGAHLDFRVFINGKAKNPLKYAKKR